MILSIDTIGHSTLKIPDFVAMCVRAGIQVVVDIRSSPSSRKNPQFYRAAMEIWLRAAGIEYIWEKPLGGHPPKQVLISPHTALRSTSFSHYGDLMLVRPEFIAARDRVLALARSGKRVAIMCAESRPYSVKDRLVFSCHRMMVSDNLMALCGAEVYHVDRHGDRELHAVTPIARVTELDGQPVLFYDDGQPALVYDLTRWEPTPRKPRLLAA